MLFSLHGLVGWVLLGLIVLHVGAALRHWLIKRDGVMARMSLFRQAVGGDGADSSGASLSPRTRKGVACPRG